MPKKEKISEEQKEEETRDESELEEEIKEDEFEEIAEKVSGENSTGKLIDETSFREFIQPSTKSTALVLEKIAESQESANLEQNIFPISTDTEKKEGGAEYTTVPYEQKYSSGREEEIKIGETNFLIRPSATIKVDTARANLRPETGQTFQINPELQTLRQSGTENPEEELYIKAGRLEENNELPFERERKYKGRKI